MLSQIDSYKKSATAKPFLKWAGGKTQLIPNISNAIPNKLKQGCEFTYIEPFVGSGALLFWMLQSYPNIKRAIINDINSDLINTYRTVADHPENLITELAKIETEYHAISNNENAKKEYYYNKRDIYNTRQSSSIKQAAIFIFLNRTCFNGLYRVNRKNDFNVPVGSYKMPKICDRENLFNVSRLLKDVEILSGDFEETINYATKPSLFYFDPPYKPLSKTSSFNSYAKDSFADNEQLRLSNFCKKLDSNGHFWILSNSDVKSKDPNDNFFDDMYSDYNILRVQAKRMINANPKKRGILSELLITNFQDE